MPDSMKDYLYHYTTAEGLIGIVKTRKIWATNILYLNDAKEFRHGIELGEKYLNTLYERAGAEDKSFFASLVTAAKRLKSNEDAPGYVCSFSDSELDDDLSQWRAYCPAGGFAVGFPKARLEEIAFEHHYMFKECVYDLDKQQKAIRDFIDLGPADDAKGQTSLAKDLGGSGEAVKLQNVINRLIATAASLKDAAFRSEKEWRMVRYPGKDAKKKGLRFRAKQGVVVPYMECSLEFKDAAVSKGMWEDIHVVVGPTPHPEASKASLEELLRTHSPAEVSGEVTVSSVPYRFW